MGEETASILPENGMEWITQLMNIDPKQLRAELAGEIRAKLYYFGYESALAGKKGASKIGDGRVFATNIAMEIMQLIEPYLPPVLNGGTQ